jgi:hypothetical protein
VRIPGVTSTGGSRRTAGAVHNSGGVGVVDSRVVVGVGALVALVGGEPVEPVDRGELGHGRLDREGLPPHRGEHPGHGHDAAQRRGQPLRRDGSVDALVGEEQERHQGGEAVEAEDRPVQPVGAEQHP